MPEQHDPEPDAAQPEPAPEPGRRDGGLALPPGSATDGASLSVPGSVTGDEAHRRGGFWRGLREMALIVVAALVISALVRTFLLQAFWVPSGSMEETLVRGDRILVWKPGDGPARGDVVVFHDPSDWLADAPEPQGVGGALQRLGTFVGVLPSSSGDDLVKRVVGVGGDTVACCSPDGRIMVNGEPIDEPYLYPGDVTDQVQFSVTVPPGRIFVMGDHRSDSADSRFHLDEQDGTVPVSDVVGRAVVIMWPISRWAVLTDQSAEASAS